MLKGQHAVEQIAATAAVLMVAGAASPVATRPKWIAFRQQRCRQGRFAEHTPFSGCQQEAGQAGMNWQAGSLLTQ